MTWHDERWCVCVCVCGFLLNLLVWHQWGRMPEDFIKKMLDKLLLWKLWWGLVNHCYGPGLWLVSKNLQFFVNFCSSNLIKMFFSKKKKQKNWSWLPVVIRRVELGGLHPEWPIFHRKWCQLRWNPSRFGPRKNRLKSQKVRKRWFKETSILPIGLGKSLLVPFTLSPLKYLASKIPRLLPSFYPRLSGGGLESTSVLRETELLRDVLRLSCRAAERDLMQTASKGHWTDG